MQTDRLPRLSGPLLHLVTQLQWQDRRRHVVKEAARALVKHGFSDDEVERIIDAARFICDLPARQF